MSLISPFIIWLNGLVFEWQSNHLNISLCSELPGVYMLIYLIGVCQMISSSSRLPDDMALLMPMFLHNLVPTVCVVLKCESNFIKFPIFSNFQKQGFWLNPEQQRVLQTRFQHWIRRTFIRQLCKSNHTGMLLLQLCLIKDNWLADNTVGARIPNIWHLNPFKIWTNWCLD